MGNAVSKKQPEMTDQFDQFLSEMLQPEAAIIQAAQQGLATVTEETVPKPKRMKKTPPPVTRKHRVW